MKFGFNLILIVTVSISVTLSQSNLPESLNLTNKNSFSKTFKDIHYYRALPGNRENRIDENSQAFRRIYSSGKWEREEVFGGDVNDIVINAAGDLFAATYTGMFRSTNNGASWEEVNTQLETATTSDIAINSAGDVFITTVDRVYKSTDNGDTWFDTELEVNSVIEALIVTENDVVFAGSGSAQGNLHRSTDNGNTWENVGLPVSTMVWQLFSIDSTRLLAGTLQAGIFISTDGGSNWTQTSLSSGITGQFAMNSSGELFVGTYGLPGGNITGVYQSTDNGNTWDKLSNQIEDLRITALAINSNDVLFAGDLDEGEIYRSSDNGVSWTKVSNGLELDFGVDRLTINQNDRIFVGSVGSGIYSSSDNGNTWQSANEGLTGYKIEGFTVKQNGDIFVSTFPGGIYRTTDNGSKWEKANRGLLIPAITALTYNGQGVLFAGSPFEVYRSLDNGQNWEIISEGLPSIINVSSMVTDRQNDIVYLGSGNNGVYFSDDNGDSWQPFNDGLTNLSVTTLAFNANGDLFAGTESGGMYRRDSGSASWTQIINGFPVPPPLPPVWSIAVNGISQNVFISLLFFGVYGSDNNGDNWSESGLTDPFIEPIAATPQGDLFAGKAFHSENRSNDVFRSTDNGNTWMSIRSGISTNSPVVSLSVDSLDNLLAGTWSSGVFKWTKGTTGLAGNEPNKPESFNLSQNYPNPFNPVTTIGYTIQKSSGVILKVYNVLGEEVKTLVNSPKAAGQHTVSWNGTNNEGIVVPSGVYIYRIETNSFVDSKKMLLLK